MGPPPGGKSSGKSCFKILLAAAAILLFLFILLAGAAALAVAATGLVEVPVLSKIIKAPDYTKDFTYKRVSTKALEKEFSFLANGQPQGKINATFTNNGTNTFISMIISSQGSGSTLKKLLVKFEPGVIKFAGVLSTNDAPFYGEIEISKSAGAQLSLNFRKVKIGSLPVPGFLVNTLLNPILGSLGISLEDIPVESISVTEGKLTLTGLDLGKMFEGQ